MRKSSGALCRNVAWIFVSSEKKVVLADINADVLEIKASGPANSEWDGLILPPLTHEDAFPKVIFQTWKSKVTLPDNFTQWSTSIKRRNPDFAYFLWDDSDNRRFIKIFYPWFLPIYDAYPREIYRADAVRYFFLYQFGGMYADMDTESLRPVGRLFESGDVWLGRMGDDSNHPHSIPNAIMASRPLQEFWLLTIYLLAGKAKALDDPETLVGIGPEAMTGPILLKQAYDTYMSYKRESVEKMIGAIAARLPACLQPEVKVSRVKLLEHHYWYPLNWSNMLHLRLSTEITKNGIKLGKRTKHWLFPHSYFVTYWTHSW
jgi:mannosyltransferase OCH1-like enzyme